MCTIGESGSLRPHNMPSPRQAYFKFFCIFIISFNMFVIHFGRPKLCNMERMPINNYLIDIYIFMQTKFKAGHNTDMVSCSYKCSIWYSVGCLVRKLSQSTIIATLATGLLDKIILIPPNVLPTRRQSTP